MGEYFDDHNLLENLFYSDKNIHIIQQSLRFSIYNLTDIAISKQSEPELRIIMKHIFNHHAKHLSHNITEQIAELNDLVVRKAVKSIIPNIKQFIGYLGEKNNESTVRTMAYPVASNKDTSFKRGSRSEMKLLV